MSFTPGPWETDKIAVRSSGNDGRQICLCEITVRGRPYDETYNEAIANARRIVTAVNAFDDMKAALKRARIDLEAAKIVIESYKNASAFGIVQTLEIVESALTKAQGQPSVSGGEEGSSQ